MTVKIGDTITTKSIYGQLLMGEVVSINDNTCVLKTGLDRHVVHLQDANGHHKRVQIPTEKYHSFDLEGCQKLGKPRPGRKKRGW